MENWKKLFKIIAIVVIFFALAYVFFLMKARHIIAAKIEQVVGRKTTIGSLDIKPPLNLEIRDLAVEGLLKVGYIYVSPSIPSLLVGRIALNKVKIVNPQLTYQRIPAPITVRNNGTAVAESAPAVAPMPEPAPAAPVAAQNEAFPIIIKSLKVYSGLLNFIDSTASSGSIKFKIKDIQFYATNLSTVGTKSATDFSLRGNIFWNTGEPDGRLFARGWVNFYKKDMLATLKIENIDAIVFYPYYSTWVDLDKARIEKAKLNFSSNIKGEDNKVSAVCHLELADIVRKVRGADEKQEKAERLTDAVLDMFKTMNEGKVVLDFTLRTKMDQPVFGFGDIKSAFEGKLMQGRAKAGLRPQDMLLFPAKVLQNGIKNGIDFSNAVVDGIFALAGGIKKIFEDAINKPVVQN